MHTEDTTRELTVPETPLEHEFHMSITWHRDEEERGELPTKFLRALRPHLTRTEAEFVAAYLGRQTSTLQDLYPHAPPYSDLMISATEEELTDGSFHTMLIRELPQHLSQIDLQMLAHLLSIHDVDAPNVMGGVS